MRPARGRSKRLVVTVVLANVCSLGACATGHPPPADRAPASATEAAPAPNAGVAPPTFATGSSRSAASGPSATASAIAPPGPSSPAAATPTPVCTTQTVAPPFGAQPRCDRDDQCTLISSKCCFCGEIPRSEVRAAHIEGRLSACAAGTTCPACAAGVPEGITGACVDHVCRGVEKICK